MTDHKQIIDTMVHHKQLLDLAARLRQAGWTVLGRELRRLANKGRTAPMLLTVGAKRYSITDRLDVLDTAGGWVCENGAIAPPLRKPGRVKGSGTLRRQVPAKLSPEEHALVRKAAKSVGSTVCEFMRESAMMRATSLVTL